jgi:hypothetical protein
MLNKIDDDGNFLRQICFTDEAIFHMNGCVNRHNWRIWGSEQSNEIHEYILDSAKVNVWCGLLCDRVVGPFFYAESTITGGIYHDMLENYFFPPQIEDLGRKTGNLVIFMQDGAPAWRRSSQRLDWEGRTNILSSQKPRSYTDGLSLWVYIKNIAYGEEIRDLRRIRNRIATVTPDMIQRTWHEIE